MEDGIQIDNQPLDNDINTSSKFSRWYCEPCYGNKDQLENLCSELTKNQNGRGSIKLEFHIKSKQYSREIYSIAIFQIFNNIPPENLENDQIDDESLSIDSIAYADLADRCDDEKEAISYQNYELDDSLFDRLCLFDQLQEKLKRMDSRNKLNPLKDNQLSFPKKLFNGLKSSFPLRICKSIPQDVNNRYIFNFSDEGERDIILKNVEYFILKPDFTHFIALPIAPKFPEWTEAMKTVLNRWNVNVRNHINRTHITIALFVIQNDDELNVINHIAQEAINEVEWPEDNTLKSSKVGYFGSAKNATILFIEPEHNAFVESLSKFIAIFMNKMYDNGFCFVEEDSNALHITMIRPKFINKRRTFDPTEYISKFNENDLPDIHIQELRLVQRFVYDDDDFYKTHFHYPLYKNNNQGENPTNDENINNKITSENKIATENEKNQNHDNN